MTSTVKEPQIEYGFIGKLTDLKYSYRSDIRDRKSLEQSFRKKFNEKESVYGRGWHSSLQPQIQDLPDFKDVVRALKKHFRKLNQKN